MQQGRDNYEVGPLGFTCVILMIDLQLERICVCVFLIEVVPFRC